MSDHGGGHGGGGKGRRRAQHEEHAHADERWLLTYSDMITLLMALFIVMWAISSVNVSKFAALRQSLREAFSGKLVSGGDGIMKGGTAILQPEGARVSAVKQPLQDPQTVANDKFQPSSGPAAVAPVGSAQAEAQNLQKIASQIEKYAQQHGLSDKIGATVDERGVVVRLLTDKLLFGAGSSDLSVASVPLIESVGKIIQKTGVTNPIRVEGNTDSTPISTARFRSNWELSTARATSVLQVLLASGIDPGRMSAAGYAETRPVASNSTLNGRYLNRHVDIVVLRSEGVASSSTSSATTTIASLR